jgi:hypothetical protein
MAVCCAGVGRASPVRLHRTRAAAGWRERGEVSRQPGSRPGEHATQQQAWPVPMYARESQTDLLTRALCPPACVGRSLAANRATAARGWWPQGAGGPADGGPPSRPPVRYRCPVHPPDLTLLLVVGSARRRCSAQLASLQTAKRETRPSDTSNQPNQGTTRGRRSSHWCILRVRATRTRYFILLTLYRSSRWLACKSW